MVFPFKPLFIEFYRGFKRVYTVDCPFTSMMFDELLYFKASVVLCDFPELYQTAPGTDGHTITTV